MSEDQNQSDAPEPVTQQLAQPAPAAEPVAQAKPEQPITPIMKPDWPQGRYICEANEKQADDHVIMENAKESPPPPKSED